MDIKGKKDSATAEMNFDQDEKMIESIDLILSDGTRIEVSLDEIDRE